MYNLSLHFFIYTKTTTTRYKIARTTTKFNAQVQTRPGKGIGTHLEFEIADFFRIYFCPLLEENKKFKKSQPENTT